MYDETIVDATDGTYKFWANCVLREYPHVYMFIFAVAWLVFKDVTKTELVLETFWEKEPCSRLQEWSWNASNDVRVDEKLAFVTSSKRVL